MKKMIIEQDALFLPDEYHCMNGSSFDFLGCETSFLTNCDICKNMMVDVEYKSIINHLKEKNGWMKIFQLCVAYVMTRS